MSLPSWFWSGSTGPGAQGALITTHLKADFLSIFLAYIPRALPPLCISLLWGYVKRCLAEEVLLFCN